MKLLAVSVGILALTVPMTMAQASTWKSDPAHSQVDFTITHLSVSKTHGRFGDVNAIIHYDQADVAKTTVQATVSVTSVNTDEPGRDDEIKSADFFDVDDYPTAKFVSTAVSKNGNGLWVKGNLTLHGVTKPVVLNVQKLAQPAGDPGGKQEAKFTATTTINRTAFGIGPGFPPGIVGDEVQLKIDLNAVKQ